MISVIFSQVLITLTGLVFPMAVFLVLCRRPKLNPIHKSFDRFPRADHRVSLSEYPYHGSLDHSRNLAAVSHSAGCFVFLFLSDEGA